MKTLKLWLMGIGLVIILIMTLLIFIQQFYILAWITGVFLLSLIITAFLNFQYVRIYEEKNNLIIRYYSVFSISRTYSTIEIPFEFLRKVKVSKFFFGLKWDLSLTVKVKHGLAEYPPVSFSAVPFKHRRRLIEHLKLLIHRNSER